MNICFIICKKLNDSFLLIWINNACWIILVVAHHGRVKVTAVKQHGVKGPRKTSPSKRTHFAWENRFRKIFQSRKDIESNSYVVYILFPIYRSRHGELCRESFQLLLQGQRPRYRIFYALSLNLNIITFLWCKEFHQNMLVDMYEFWFRTFWFCHHFNDN